MIEQAKEVAQRLREWKLPNYLPVAEHPMLEAADAIAALIAEVEKLQKVLDSRPAINAGLPWTYIEWTQAVYAMEFSKHEVPQ